MWKGRFQKETSNLVQLYGESVSYDNRLYAHDIQGSKAHAAALEKAGIITSAELSEIGNGLDSIQRDIEAGTFQWDVTLEDVHMNIESALTDRIGAPGAKLHTARSRNDQVATDTRLYCRDAIASIRGKISNLQRALVGRGLNYHGAVIPGYTHLQRGQPVLFAHHLLAYVEMFDRDTARLADASTRLNVLPLGSGALAGSTIPLDRGFVAAQLGFDSVSQNSMDAVSDRDYIVEILAALALLGIHLSRLSEDIILWASAEFDFIKLSDAHTTGSSLMPQKKNPDVAELTRGKTGRLVGNLTTLLVAVKGLPMTYNRDLQEDKEPLFDSIDTVEIALDVFTEMVAEMEVKTANTRAAASDPMLLATDVADYLVRKGVPFRKSHEIVGSLVAICLEKDTPLDQLTLTEFQTVDEVFTEDVFDIFNLDTALAARTATGAPSPDNVRTQLERWNTTLT
ncbi:MAG: argininosuccinate lyase [Verrucomicrobiales bacterium]|nr:argininosuccinate lyase [Verrucomicrobiales bacterium]